MALQFQHVFILLYISHSSAIVHGYINCLSEPTIKQSTNCSCATITGGGVADNLDVILGESVTLPCLISAETDKVYWLSGTTILLVNDTSFPRYFMYGSTPGHYNLTIINMSYEDQNTFSCQIRGCPDNNQLQYEVNYWAIPDGPYIDNVINLSVAVVENEVTNLTCHAYNAKPNATLEWYFSDSNLGGQQDLSTSEPDQLGMYNTTATLTFTPSRTQNGNSFICTMTNDAIEISTQSTPSTTITISVYVQPTTPNITGVQGNTLTINGNQKTNVTCEALNGYPGPTITWYKGLPPKQDKVSSTQTANTNGAVNVTARLEIDGTMDNDNVTYSCFIETESPLISVTKSFVVNVQFPPEGPYITDETKDGEYTVIENEFVNITCEAWNAKPVANVSWYKGNDQLTEEVTKRPPVDKLQNSSATLCLRPSLDEDNAIYTCVMNNDALITESPCIISAQEKNISLIVWVLPVGPIIEGLDPQRGTISLKENEPISIGCSAINGKPKPNVTWYRENVALESKGDNISEIHGQYNVTAYLRLLGNIADQNVQFSCNVINDAMIAPATSRFYLQVLTPLSSLEIAAIAVAIAIFLLILIFVIICIYKRRKKTKQREIEEPPNKKIDFISDNEDIELTTRPNYSKVNKTRTIHV